MTVSVFTTFVSVSILLAATLLFGVEAWIANVIATSVATVPSFQLNRRWTWGRRDPAHPWREVVPFWILAFAGLALSTVTVSIADSWASGASASFHIVAILAGHLGGFGLLWVAQFVILDRVLFAGASPAQVLATRSEYRRCSSSSSNHTRTQASGSPARTSAS
jgi:putative flippase GtrA